MDTNDGQQFTLIDWIEAQMMNDDEPRERQSERLRAVYDDASAEQRNTLDDALICLCGYSLQTAIHQMRPRPDVPSTEPDEPPSELVMVGGSSGSFAIDRDGFPVGPMPEDYADITRFATDEWLRHYGRDELPRSIDILDLAHFSRIYGYGRADQKHRGEIARGPGLVWGERL